MDVLHAVLIATGVIGFLTALMRLCATGGQRQAVGE
jgi:hypothetical protein